jgi:hypothetical protein
LEDLCKSYKGKKGKQKRIKERKKKDLDQSSPVRPNPARPTRTPETVTALPLFPLTGGPPMSDPSSPNRHPASTGTAAPLHFAHPPPLPRTATPSVSLSKSPLPLPISLHSHWKNRRQAKRFLAGVCRNRRRSPSILARLRNPASLFDLSPIALSLAHVLMPGLAQNRSGMSPSVIPEVAADSSRPPASSRDAFVDADQGYKLHVASCISSVYSLRRNPLDTRRCRPSVRPRRSYPRR